jgi:hypothetical protein
MIIAPLQISVAVEGMIDEAVLRRLVEQAGASLGPVYGKCGKAQLLRRLKGYNSAAHFHPWIVLVDLDQDADCAPPFRAMHLPTPASHMCFRVAVREVEAWLMADQEALARFLSLPPKRIPIRPDAELDAKRKLVDIARLSRRRAIREQMVPRPESGRDVGQAYTSLMIEFSQTQWRPAVAEEASESLRRCRARLKELVERHPIV